MEGPMPDPSTLDAEGDDDVVCLRTLLITYTSFQKLEANCAMRSH